jgi:hypothetical protein
MGETMRRFGRFIVEYMGNLDLLDHKEPELRPHSADRRTNHHNRELVDWVKAQMEARGFPAAGTHEFVDDLRRALRQADSRPGSVSEDEKEVSRDAPA